MERMVQFVPENTEPDVWSAHVDTSSLIIRLEKQRVTGAHVRYVAAPSVCVSVCISGWSGLGRGHPSFNNLCVCLAPVGVE